MMSKEILERLGISLTKRDQYSIIKDGVVIKTRIQGLV